MYILSYYYIYIKQNIYIYIHIINCYGEDGREDCGSATGTSD